MVTENSDQKKLLKMVRHCFVEKRSKTRYWSPIPEVLIIINTIQLKQLLNKYYMKVKLNHYGKILTRSVIRVL